LPISYHEAESDVGNIYTFSRHDDGHSNLFFEKITMELSNLKIICKNSILFHFIIQLS